MKNTKNLLIAAAVTGALAALPGVARANVLTPISGPSADKMGCGGAGGKQGDKQGDKQSDKQGDKQSCQAKDDQGKKDKHACSGKGGCGGKDKQK
jgi:hypothetical protein